MTHHTDEFHCQFLFVGLLKDADQAVPTSVKSTGSGQCHSGERRSLPWRGKQALSLAALLKRPQYVAMYNGLGLKTGACLETAKREIFSLPLPQKNYKRGNYQGELQTL